jgi:hypothetical protein
MQQFQQAWGPVSTGSKPENDSEAVMRLPWTLIFLLALCIIMRGGYELHKAGLWPL